MLDENGNVYEDIFIGDGLHMNKKGYVYPHDAPPKAKPRPYEYL